MPRTLEREITGGGPWTFENPSGLAAGESHTFDFANIKQHGTNGFFRKWLPFDSIQITNLDTDAPLDFTVNGIYDGFVVPNASEGYSKTSVHTLQITNADSVNAIAAGNIRVEAAVSPYDQDEAAREDKHQPGIVKAIKGVGGVLL